MKGVAPAGKANDLTVAACSTSLRVFQFFQDKHVAPFAHHETIAIPVERTRCVFWGLIARRSGLDRAKASHSDRRDARLTGPCNDDIDLSILNQLVAVADGINA